MGGWQCGLNKAIYETTVAPSLTMNIFILIIFISWLPVAALLGENQIEKLNRGTIAVNQPGKVFISWRLLGADREHAAFNVYRTEDGGDPIQVNREPISGPTHYVDTEADTSKALSYSVQLATKANVDTASPSTRTWDDGYLEIPIKSLPDYRPGDASVADLDGDGDYEIVLHQTSRGRDNAHPGITGTPILDAYELNGTHLWRIDLGVNIREGEHYTQFMVYDLDGDGRAELACKTADGTKDGVGRLIGDANKDWRNKNEGDRRHGRILEGPEYFTIFDGMTGAALRTVDYFPSRDPIDGWGGVGGNGGNDNYGNRCDRFLACVAYLDGERPSVVMCRGVYGRTVMAAWDWRDGELTKRWVFDSGVSYPPYEDASPYSGMGGHSLSVADVDNDGKDEIVYQAMVVDHDGSGLFSTGRRHGDSMHIGDFYPDRPGLELYLITENEGRTKALQTPGAGMHDARTGEVLWNHSPGIDIKTGLVADIDPRFPGAEAWSDVGGLRDASGKEIGPCPHSSGFAIWWDGDLLRELIGRRSSITKWDWETGHERTLLTTSEGTDRRRWGRRPCLVGDLLGDWREELLLPSPDGKSLRLYTTTIPTKHRVATLMQDRQYRLGIVWQNVVYNKPAHPSFYLGEGKGKVSSH